MKWEEGKATAQKCVQRRTAKNKMATKVLQKFMAFSCFYDKLHLQKSSNFLKNCKFKVCRRNYMDDLPKILYFLKFTVYSFAA